jgi:alkylation response protein AidB-like acyl-CoA dehydrogenase
VTAPAAPDATQQELLAVLRDVCEERLAPRAGPDDRAGEFPRDLFDAVAGLGVTGLLFPSDAGGMDQPFGFSIRVLEELGRAHLAVGLAVSVHTLSTWAVATYGGAALQETLLPRFVSGEWLLAYCLSEAHSGSDAAALSTRAVPDGDGYVLTGTKAWVTHSTVADAYLVFARTGEGASGISAFVVPADAAGVEPAPPERKMGLRASPTGEVRFEGVRVPGSQRVGDEGQGFRIAMRGLDGGRIGVASLAVGVAQDALDASAVYTREREQFGRPVAEFQGVQFMLADMATRVEAARGLVRGAAALREADEPHTSRAAMAKLFATDTAMAVTTDAVQLHGGAGYTEDHRVERLMREAKAMQIFEGTNQIQRVVIARDLLR